jgi:hypothetical protein
MSMRSLSRRSSSSCATFAPCTASYSLRMLLMSCMSASRSPLSTSPAPTWGGWWWWWWWWGVCVCVGGGGFRGRRKREGAHLSARLRQCPELVRACLLRGGQAWRTVRCRRKERRGRGGRGKTQAPLCLLIRSLTRLRPHSFRTCAAGTAPVTSFLMRMRPHLPVAASHCLNQCPNHQPSCSHARGPARQFQQHFSRQYQPVSQPVSHPLTISLTRPRPHSPESISRTKRSLSRRRRSFSSVSALTCVRIREDARRVLVG